jgi:hypothetical protein
MPWDPARPWHPRHRSARQPTDPTDPALADQPAAPAEGLPPSPPPPNYLVGTWQSGVVDPRTWGFGARPSHEYVVKVGTARQLLLRCIRDAADANPYGALRPAIWADTPGGPAQRPPRSGEPLAGCSR